MALAIELMQAWALGAIAVGLWLSGEDAWHSFRGKR